MNQHLKQNSLLIVIHVIGWGIVFSLPLFFFHSESQPPTWRWYLGFCFVPLTCLIVFYTNLLFLIEHVLFRKKLVRYLLINLVYVTILGLLLHFWQEYHRAHFATPLSEAIKKVEKSRPHPPTILFLGRDMLLMGLTIGLSVAIKMTGNWYKIEREKQELEKARAEAELKNLKSQLNPHFLFNTLNNIYALIATNPDRAQFAVQDLSRLLRHVLYDNAQDLIPIEREFDFTRSYIKLMSLRLSPSTSLEVNIPEHGNGILVAPLLFIPLVENAFKHGVSNTRPSFIKILVDTSIPGRLDCIVENSNFPKKDNDRSGSGIGLTNLRRRLELLYPGKYDFQTGATADCFSAHLTIYLQNSIA